MRLVTDALSPVWAGNDESCIPKHPGGNKLGNGVLMLERTKMPKAETLEIIPSPVVFWIPCMHSGFSLTRSASLSSHTPLVHPRPYSFVLVPPRCCRRNQTFWKCPAGRCERRREQGGPRKCLNIMRWLPGALPCPSLSLDLPSLPCPNLTLSHSHTCESVCPLCPLLPPTWPFFSLCGKHLKKKKKAGKIPVKQCGLNILFLGVVMASFLVMMIQSFWENSCTVSELFDLRVCVFVCPPRVSLSLSLPPSLPPPLSFSLFQVCVQCYIHLRSPNLLSELRGKKRTNFFFLFSLFQCDGGTNYRRQDRQSKKGKKRRKKTEEKNRMRIQPQFVFKK